MPVTMRDVAERAGVSIATVSFVVNNSKPVSAKTRERIEQAMLELGFQPNFVARALASRRTHIIALAYPAQEHPLDRSGLEFVLSAARRAKASHHHLVIWPIANEADELMALVGQRLVDGVVLMEVQLDDARVDALQACGLPFALIGRTRDPEGLAYVDIDFDATMEAALDHLQGLGHRNIVFACGSSDEPGYRLYGPFVRQESAYRRLMEERGLTPRILYTGPDAQAATQAAVDLEALAPEATAVLVGGEQIASGLMAGLRRRGRRIPEDISVMSTVASRATAATCFPTLSIVASPGVELGRLAVDALLTQLAGGPIPPPELRAGVVEPAESTGPAPDRQPEPA
jgi:DNA-binding LacI/PurR family transcriptional regulator